MKPAAQARRCPPEAQNPGQKGPFVAIILSVKLTQHLVVRLHVFLLSVGLVFGMSGCWWLQQAKPRPPGKLADWGITRLAVVEFSDATHQDVGKRVSDIFRQELAGALGKEWIRLDQLEAPEGPRPVGLIGIGQAQRLGRLNQVNGLLTGQVVAYHHQARPGRVWVSVSLRLLETERGTIIWSRHATGTAPIAPSTNRASARETAMNAGFNEAIKLAAKEFIHDLLGSPS